MTALPGLTVWVFGSAGTAWGARHGGGRSGWLLERNWAAAAWSAGLGPGAGGLGKGAEGFDQARGELVELLLVVFGELVEHARAGGRKLKDDNAPVDEVRFADKPAGVFAAGREFDRAVVFESEALGEVADGCGDSGLSSGDLQEKLVLLRSEAGAVGGFLGEVKEAAQDVAEVGECAGAGCAGQPGGGGGGERAALGWGENFGRHDLYRNTIHNF